jgi:hypothetical protein
VHKKKKYCRKTEHTHDVVVVVVHEFQWLKSKTLVCYKFYNSGFVYYLSFAQCYGMHTRSHLSKLATHLQSPAEIMLLRGVSHFLALPFPWKKSYLLKAKEEELWKLQIFHHANI